MRVESARGSGAREHGSPAVCRSRRSRTCTNTLVGIRSHRAFFNSLTCFCGDLRMANLFPTGQALTAIVEQFWAARARRPELTIGTCFSPKLVAQEPVLK